MGLSNPRIVYGVHQVTAYNIKTGVPYGTAKCIGNSSFNMTGEQVELYGGSQKAPWAIEDANINTEIQFSFKSLEDWMFAIFMGATVNSVKTPSTTGEVNNFAAVKGTTLKSATTGIASIAPKTGSESSLKFGKYAVVAASATTVNVYALTDIDFKRGTGVEYLDDSLKVNASALTITTGAKTELTGFGFEFQGGSGTIAMTVGDTATFEVVPPYTAKMETVLGGSSDIMPEFGALMIAQKRGSDELFEIDAFRCKGSGLPLGLAEKKFAEPEVKAKAFYDSAKNGIAKITWIQV